MGAARPSKGEPMFSKTHGTLKLTSTPDLTRAFYERQVSRGEIQNPPENRKNVNLHTIPAYLAATLRSQAKRRECDENFIITEALQNGLHALLYDVLRRGILTEIRECKQYIETNSTDLGNDGKVFTRNQFDLSCRDEGKVRMQCRMPEKTYDDVAKLSNLLGFGKHVIYSVAFMAYLLQIPAEEGVAKNRKLTMRDDLQRFKGKVKKLQEEATAKKMQVERRVEAAEDDGPDIGLDDV